MFEVKVRRGMIKIGMCCIISLAGLNSALGQKNQAVSDKKINGVSMVSINGEIDSSNVLPVKDLGARWAATIPFAFMPSHTSPKLSYDLKWQWKAERIEGTRNYIRELHAQGISVMVKPQIWIGRGTYTGEILMESDDDWTKLEKNYEKYILAFAELAEEESAEMLCIGTELKHFVEKRSGFWVELIAQLREVYSGKLTYAANWDDYDNVPFWAELDFIGVDAYFPIAKREGASASELIEGWESHKNKMDTISQHYERPILFTEFGYRSISNCAVKPWDYSEGGKQSEKAQQLALEVLFKVFWEDENFAGGFLWKWYPNHQNAGGASDKMFTVQNKKAEKTVKRFYSI